MNGETRISIFQSYALWSLAKKEIKVFLSFLLLLPCSAGRFAERFHPFGSILSILPLLRGGQRMQRQDRAILRDALQRRKVRKNP